MSTAEISEQTMPSYMDSSDPNLTGEEPHLNPNLPMANPDSDVIGPVQTEPADIQATIQSSNTVPKPNAVSRPDTVSGPDAASNSISKTLDPIETLFDPSATINPVYSNSNQAEMENFDKGSTQVELTQKKTSKGKQETKEDWKEKKADKEVKGRFG